MNGLHFDVRRGGEEAVEVIRGLALLDLADRRPARPQAGEEASGRPSSKANHTGGREPSGRTSFSEKDVNGTTQRFSTPSHRRQCGDDTLRMFVTPGSRFLPLRISNGEGMPQRAMTSSRPSAPLRTIGAK